MGSQAQGSRRGVFVAGLVICFIVGVIIGLFVHPLVFHVSVQGGEQRVVAGHPLKVFAYSAWNNSRVGVELYYDGHTGLLWRAVGSNFGFGVNFTSDYQVLHLTLYSKLNVNPDKDLTFTVTVKDASGHTVAYGSRTIKAIDLESNHGMDIKLTWTTSPDPSKIYEIDIAFPENI